MGNTTDLSSFEKGLFVGTRLAGPRFRRFQASLGFQKQPNQKFSRVGIRTHSPSLEDLTAVRAQISERVIGVVYDELYGRTGTLL